jgi:2-polyprenyl-3-methyl-5-hydroxy-6-metoxy-1,4-benzoquinol methylase
MNRDYWDRQVDHWDDDIFNSLREDVHGVIRRAIHRAARRHTSAIDFGCGVGGYLFLLAREFETVHAVDWSPRCVARARERTARLRNVTVERNTPRALKGLERSFGCVVAANVVIHADGRVRRRLWRAIRRVVKRGSSGLFVVPSLESAALCEFFRRHTAPSRSASYDFHPGAGRAEAGTVSIEGVATKHYTEDELRAVLAAARFRVVKISRVRYRWSTEALVPPRRMRTRLPWDWLVEARAT